MRIVFLSLLIVQTSATTWWYNETVACNWCGQMVYGVLFSQDIDALPSAISLMSQYTYCPKWFPYVDLDYCTSTLTQLFKLVYVPTYYVGYPFRDYYCKSVCGGSSGENFTIT